MSPATSTRNGVLGSLAGIAALCVALSAPETAWAYSAESNDQDVLESCKDFNVDGSGVLSANCNEWSSHGDVYGVRARTIDLDEKIGYDGALKYNQSDFSAECENESVTSSSGKLTLKATCSGKDVGIRVDDRIYNQGSSAAGAGTPGLYWRGGVGPGQAAREPVSPTDE